MKTALLFTTVCLLLIAHVAQGQAPTNGLVAYYPFTGNANDGAGSLNGIVNGATLANDRFGNANQAYAFNGSSSIDFATPPTTVTDNWTVSVWVNLATLSQVGTFVSVGYDDGISVGDGYELGIGSEAAASNNLQGAFGGVTFISTGYSFANTNSWYHVVMRRTNGLTQFFVNGVFTSQSSTGVPKTPTDFTIGSINNNRFFTGSVDEVRIYDRALSDAEVGQVFQAECVSSITLIASGSITCDQTSLTLTATGGTSYTFAGQGIVSTNATSGTALVNQLGTYSVTAVNASGCMSATSIFVNQDLSPPTLSLTPMSGTLTCNNPSLTLTATSSTTSLRWNTLATTTSITVNSAGTYSITATAPNGCTAVASSVISQSTTPPIAGLVASGTLTCAVRTVTLTAAGGSGNSYVFSGPSGSPSGVVQSAGNSATVNVGGLYSVTITNVTTGCSNTATYTVESATTAPTPTLNANFGAALTCSQLSLTLTATGAAGVPGTPYRFAGPGITSQNQIAGTAVINASGPYSVTVTNTVTGCFSTTSLSVSQNSSGSVSISLTANNILSCSNPAPLLTATPGAANYRFSGPGLTQNGPNNTATASTTGVFSVTATSGVCSSSATVTLTGGAGTPPNALLFGNGSLSCQTPTVSLTAVGGSRYSFSRPGGTSAGIVSQTDGRERLIVGDYILFRTPIPTLGMAVVNRPGTYSVLVTDDNGCSTTATIVVTGTACP